MYDAECFWTSSVLQLLTHLLIFCVDAYCLTFFGDPNTLEAFPPWYSIRQVINIEIYLKRHS